MAATSSRSTSPASEAPRDPRTSGARRSGAAVGALALACATALGCGSGSAALFGSGGGGSSGNAAPTVALRAAPAGYAPDPSPAAPRGIPLPFVASDAEGDAVRVVVQWAPVGEPFAELPADAAGFGAALASATERARLRLAAALDVRVTGPVHALGPTRLALPALARTALPRAEEASGATLALLRPRGGLTRASSAWGANPLERPRLARARSETAVLVADNPVDGSWRLTSIELASGAADVGLASGADGDPTALALAPAGDGAFLALASPGGWRLLRVGLPDGAVAELARDDGTLAAGTVRGLLPLGSGALLLTLEDGLFRADFDPSAPEAGARVHRVAGGLAAPGDLVGDPRASGRVLVTERDGIAPGSAGTVGRVAVVDLATREVTALIAGARGLPRPERLAVEAGGRHLLVVTDADTLDGERELVGLEFGRAGAEPVPLAVLAEAVGDLSTGRAGLRLLALPSSHDLLVSGGVEAVRAVRSVDPARGAIELSAPFEAVPAANAVAELRVPGDRAAASPEGTAGCFRWDGAGVPLGAEVRVRALAYDGRPGPPAELAQPLALASPLQPGPLTDPPLGAATAAAPTAVLAADVDGDGDLDLVGADAGPAGGGGALRVYLAAAGPAFGEPAATELGGASPLARPVALVAGDFDRDGTLDLASANAGSEDLWVARGLGGGAFSTAETTVLEPHGAGPGADGPRALVAADLDGDGRLDLACANVSSGDLTVFPADAAGGFGSPAATVLGAGGLAAPVALAAADLDLDGTLELVAAERDGDALAVFGRDALGELDPVVRSRVELGRSAEAPAALVAGDLDLDGAVELACASSVRRSLVVLGLADAATLELAPLAEPSASPGGGPGGSVATGYAYLLAADADGDGRLELVAGGEAAGELRLFDRAAGGSAAEAPGGAWLDAALGTGPAYAANGACVADLDGDGRPDWVLALPDDGGGAAGWSVHVGGAPTRFAEPLVLGGPGTTRAPADVALADLDADGDLDLASANFDGDDVTVFRQVEPARFEAAPAVVGAAALAGPAALVAGDWDADGRVDLAVASQLANAVAVFPQAADGTAPRFGADPLQSLGDGDFGALPVDLAAADLDLDGLLDLVVGEADRWLAFHGRAAGDGEPFEALPRAASAAGEVPPALSALALADWNADGRVDVATLSTTGDVVGFAQSAAGAFAPDAGLALATGALASDLALVDLDGDHALDVAAATALGDRVDLFVQTAPGAFPAVPVSLGGASATDGVAALAAVDLDGDGLLDLLAANRDGADVALFLQRPCGGFEALPARSVDPRGAPVALAVADLDGDGAADLVTANRADDVLAVLFAGRSGPPRPVR